MKPNPYVDAAERSRVYSTADVTCLLRDVRNRFLTFVHHRSKATPGDSPLVENEQLAVVLDPCHGENVSHVLESVAPTLRVCCRELHGTWSTMPSTVLLPFYTPERWRLVAAQMDYEKRSAIIFWIDPRGRGAFPRRLMDSIRFPLANYISEFTQIQCGLTNAHTTQPERPFVMINARELEEDIQGYGVNEIDSGPIVVQIVRDFILGTSVPSILPACDPQHEDQMAEIREADLKVLKEVRLHNSDYIERENGEELFIR
ncbi:PREDICTED: uncharacterized protein LOC109471515 [Branchiostoma belcheri]|uniref:Uncharacterized protein LOC109471515 n=1 Tax=Branchiostoma belcheri TaxID=7741 RepID=A0A6P4Z5Q6_BRABE|nr:PREDICTED: uncharacterized protein LOC109471515 [Branchiostoma belcheri]